MVCRRRPQPRGRIDCGGVEWAQPWREYGQEHNDSQNDQCSDDWPCFDCGENLCSYGCTFCGHFPTPVLPVTALITNTRVEYGVKNVNHQVDDDVREGEQQDQALDHREVSRQHGFHYEAAQSRQIEHGLCDDHATDERGDSNADNGDDRDGCIAQAMSQEDKVLAQTFGSCSADEVLAHDLDDAASRDAGD